LERAGKCTGARFTPGCNRLPKHEIFSSFQSSPARSGPLIIKSNGKNGKKIVKNEQVYKKWQKFEQEKNKTRRVKLIKLIYLLGYEGLSL
jgi:hypothetical protein